MDEDHDGIPEKLVEDGGRHTTLLGDLPDDRAQQLIDLYRQHITTAADRFPEI